MEQTLTAKLRILPSEEDAHTLVCTMHAYSDACNFVSEYIYTSHILSQSSLHKVLYFQIRNKFGLPSQVACSVIRTVIARYKAIRSQNHKWIKPSFRKPQLDLCWNKDYTINRHKLVVSISTIKGRVKAPLFTNNADFAGRFGTAKLVYKHGKFFLYVPITREISVTPLGEIANVVGVDRGIRFLATTYDSNGESTFYSGSAVKEKRSHYSVLRKQLQQVGTSSSRRRLKAIGHRENRWMQDVNHCISKALVESNPEGTLFVLEDLSNVRKATERVRKGDRYVLVSWSFFDLEQKLAYKALKNHQRVIFVDPAYTSQTCPKCGHVSKSNRDKKNHVFCCESCGYRSNDDRIGAMNLYRMGIEYLVESQVSTSDLCG